MLQTNTMQFWQKLTHSLRILVTKCYVKIPKSVQVLQNDAVGVQIYATNFQHDLHSGDVRLMLDNLIMQQCEKYHVCRHYAD